MVVAPVGATNITPVRPSISATPFGAATMATPTVAPYRWRSAQSPASGNDHLGPTAVIGSVGKLPTGSILGGVAQP